MKAKRDELKRKYMELRFQMVIGHVDNPLQKRNMRRQIARLNTLIHLQDLADKKAGGASGAEAK
jgi:large subunit ribosomal protein L29